MFILFREMILALICLVIVLIGGYFNFIKNEMEFSQYFVYGGGIGLLFVVLLIVRQYLNVLKEINEH